MQRMIDELDSLAGYLRTPGPVHTQRQPSTDRNYLVAITIGRGSTPACGPRVVGHLVLRGYLAQSRPKFDGALAGSPLGPAPAGTDTWLEGAHLRPIGRLEALSKPEDKQPALRVVQSGQAYRIMSPANQNLVAPALARTLESFLEQFAVGHGFTRQAPIAIAFSRGYEAGDRGHGSGLAVDIASVGGRGLLEWKHDWDRALAQSRQLPDAESRRALMTAEAQRNLGYRLYDALMEHGGWRVFNNVVQLFGPWTDRLGPWRRLRFNSPTEAQSQLMAEQEHIFQAHQDHIHVAVG